MQQNLLDHRHAHYNAQAGHLISFGDKNWSPAGKQLPAFAYQN
jgi:hypothetical protein